MTIPLWCDTRYVVTPHYIVDATIYEFEPEHKHLFLAGVNFCVDDAGRIQYNTIGDNHDPTKSMKSLSNSAKKLIAEHNVADTNFFLRLEGIDYRIIKGKESFSAINNKYWDMMMEIEKKLPDKEWIVRQEKPLFPFFFFDRKILRGVVMPCKLDVNEEIKTKLLHGGNNERD